jgi:Cdc6-like AAA superfamily ATPase
MMRYLKNGNVSVSVLNASREDALRILEHERLQLIYSLSLRNKVCIIKGPTGVGKTYQVKELARKLITEDK